MNKFINGFTLIETLVALIITSVILFFSVSMATNFNRERVSEEFFWKAFQSKFTRVEEFSRVHHRPTTIIYRPHRQVEFNNPAFSRRELKLSILKMPKSLSTVETYQTRISASGHVNPQTVKWYSNAKHEKLLQKFQLGWGIYHVVAES